MMEIQRVQKRNPGLKVCLGVSTSGTLFTIDKDEYEVDGKTFELTEPFTYIMGQNDKPQTVIFHLVRRKSTGESLIMVDDMIDGEIPYVFTEDEEFIHIHNIADVSIPAGATDFSDAKCLLYQELGTKETTNG